MLAHLNFITIIIGHNHIAYLIHNPLTHPSFTRHYYLSFIHNLTQFIALYVLTQLPLAIQRAPRLTTLTHRVLPSLTYTLCHTNTVNTHFIPRTNYITKLTHKDISLPINPKCKQKWIPLYLCSTNHTYHPSYYYISTSHIFSQHKEQDELQVASGSKQAEHGSTRL